MPEYIAIIICIGILALTGAVKRPWAAMGLSLFEGCYMLLCALALSVFQLRIGVEVSVNLGAAVLTLLPGLLVKRGMDGSAGAGAAVLISITIALLKHGGGLFGAESGLLCGLMAGASAFIYGDNPSQAACAAGGIPMITAAMESVLALVFSGYAVVEIGHEIIAAQLIALMVCTVVIWVNSLLPERAGAK